jgi:thiamine-phosphate pyrophosphorylase
LEELRYELYTLEKAVFLTHTARERLQGRELYVLVSSELCPNGSGPVIAAALAGGAGIIQVREKKISDRELVTYGRLVREWTARAGALFIMNDRPDLAVLTDADGVHVGQEELPVREARRIVGPTRLVGLSTHSLEQARQAVLDGADYIGVGPVFSSTTKAFERLAGLDLVRQVAAEISVPAYAIGGIGLENVDEVLSAGARRIAVSSAICGAADPGEAARALRAKLATHSPP